MAHAALTAIAEHIARGAHVETQQREMWGHNSLVVVVVVLCALRCCWAVVVRVCSGCNFHAAGHSQRMLLPLCS